MRELKFSGINIEVKGRLTGDPELRLTPSGKDVCTATVAVQGGWMSKEKGDCPQGWKEAYGGKGWEYTLFIRLTAWGRHATRLSGMRKGDVVHVETKLKGELRDGTCYPRTYVSSTGQARASWEMQIAWFCEGESAVAADEAEPPYTEADEIPW